jgi:hypothetical protein
MLAECTRYGKQYEEYVDALLHLLGMLMDKTIDNRYLIIDF